MRFPRLCRKSLRIVVYCDASFANNDDMSSQMGYIVFLTDAQNRCAPLSYKSIKCKRVTRSVLAAEAIAFAEGFDQGYALKCNLKELLGTNVPLTLMTDSKTLFDVITKASYTREKRILIDLASVREGYRRFDIDDIGLIASEENLADGFTATTFVIGCHRKSQNVMICIACRQCKSLLSKYNDWHCLQAMPIITF